jgi:trimeric autotransporter adhesin
VASPAGFALFGLGNARVTGDLTAQGLATSAGARYRIDHPSNAAPDRSLSHALVGSSEWKNVYDGSVLCDPSGEALVELPAWFGRLNQDARIQLTPVGSYSPVYVAQKVSGNRFRIAGGTPGQEVHWLITATRKDRWAQAHPLRVEERKRGVEAGRLLHPEERGAAATRGVTEAFRLKRRRRRFR